MNDLNDKDREFLKRRAGRLIGEDELKFFAYIRKRFMVYHAIIAGLLCVIAAMACFLLGMNP